MRTQWYPTVGYRVNKLKTYFFKNIKYVFSKIPNPEEKIRTATTATSKTPLFFAELFRWILMYFLSR